MTFAIDVRDESINFLGDTQTGYYRATYSSTVDAVVHFLDDYDDSNAESVRLDLSYVENWSPSLDAMILLRTTTAVVRGDGAY